MERITYRLEDIDYGCETLTEEEIAKKETRKALDKRIEKLGPVKHQLRKKESRFIKSLVLGGTALALSASIIAFVPEGEPDFTFSGGTLENVTAENDHYTLTFEGKKLYKVHNDVLDRDLNGNIFGEYEYKFGEETVRIQKQEDPSKYWFAGTLAGAAVLPVITCYRSMKKEAKELIKRKRIS